MDATIVFPNQLFKRSPALSRKRKIFNLTNDFEYPEDGPTQIYLIDKPGVTQSVIYMGHKSNKFDIDGEYFKSRVMNYPFGGGASARLFLNLREDKGYMCRKN